MMIHQTIQYDKNLPAKIRLRDGPAEKCRGKPHWHEEMQLLYVDSGILTATIGKEKAEFRGGDVLIINSGEAHSLKSSNARYLSVHLSQMFVKQFSASADNDEFVLPDGSQEKCEMTVLLQKLLAVEQNAFDEYRALVKYSLLTKMLRLLLTRCRRERQLSVYGAGRTAASDAQAVRRYIEQNFRRKIMLAEVAAQTRHKEQGFSTYFKELTGKCFSDYLQEVRLRHALDDFLEHDISVGDAAIKNGFGHYNHFTKACRKLYGASPTEIKRQKRQRDAESDHPLEKSA